MAETKISSRYARSFLEISVEKNILDKTFSDMRSVYNAFESSRELRLAISSPIIKSETKESILKDLFEGKFDPETMNFIIFIISKRREDLLQSIAKRFLEIRDEHLGIIRATVYSAFDLSAEQKNQLLSRFEAAVGKKVIISYEINDTLLGGFTAKIGDTIYDASVVHQLQQLKKYFVKVGISLN